MPENSLNIFSHLERLGPPYQDGYVTFSLNISAALTQTAGDITYDNVSDFLQPWNWRWSKVRLRGIKKLESGSFISETIEDIDIVGDGLPSADKMKDFLLALSNALTSVA